MVLITVSPEVSEVEVDHADWDPQEDEQGQDDLQSVTLTNTHKKFC